jgi:hypothetical protein
MDMQHIYHESLVPPAIDRWKFIHNAPVGNPSRPVQNQRGFLAIGSSPSFAIGHQNFMTLLLPRINPQVEKPDKGEYPPQSIHPLYSPYSGDSQMPAKQR